MSMSKDELLELVINLTKRLANMEDGDRVCEDCHSPVVWTDAAGKVHKEICYCRCDD